MSGRVEGCTSYVEEKNLPETALGYAAINIHLRDSHGKEESTTLELTPRIFTPGTVQNDEQTPG